MDGYSLGDIIENFGTLNENLLQKISYSLLNCLFEYEEKFHEDFGDICPCNILFDKYGNLKVINFFNIILLELNLYLMQ
jgi:hypothetical protein